MVHPNRRRALAHGNHLARERRLFAHTPMEQPPGNRRGTDYCRHLRRHGDAERFHRLDPVAAQSPHDVAGSAQLAVGGHPRSGGRAAPRGADPLTPPPHITLRAAAPGEHGNRRQAR